MEGLGIDLKVIIAQIINFFVLLYVLQRFLFKPLLKAMDQRRANLDKGLAYTDEMEKKLADIGKKEKETLKKAQQKGEKQAEDIVAQAQKSKEALLKEAHKESEALIAQAKQTIADERKAMVKEVNDQAGVLAVATAEQVLKSSLSEQDQKEFVAHVIDKLSSQKVSA